MNLKTAKIIFWGGTISSLLIFLILTFDSMTKLKKRTNESELSDVVYAGKKVFKKYNCNDCHTILGIGGYYAPDLTRVYGRRGEKYISTVILEPEKTLAKSFRKMPKKYAGGQSVTPEELTKLIAFFKWVDKIDTNKWPPQDHKQKAFGQKSNYAENSGDADVQLLKDHGCFACHNFRNAGNAQGLDLTEVGARLSKKEIEKILHKGKEGGMPPFKAADNVIKTVAERLSLSKGGSK
jgi:nitric oxide reductase subunit C